MLTLPLFSASSSACQCRPHESTSPLKKGRRCSWVSTAARDAWSSAEAARVAAWSTSEEAWRDWRAIDALWEGGGPAVEAALAAANEAEAAAYAAQDAARLAQEACEAVEASCGLEAAAYLAAGAALDHAETASGLARLVHVAEAAWWAGLLPAQVRDLARRETEAASL